jgi:hypothetical protein
MRRKYIEARKSLRVEALKPSDADVKTFPKAEKTNFTAKNDPPPRIISPRDPRYNYELGKFITPVEGVMYGVLNDMCGGPTVMKGKNSVQVGESLREMWDSFSKPVAVPYDAKRFDQHTGEEVLKWEHKQYVRCYTGNDASELKRLLKMQIKTKCRAYFPEGKIKFDMKMRCSGDMNTGLGTCVIACGLTYGYCSSVGLRYRLMNNGDDCVLLCEEDDLHKLQGLHEYCKSAGYWMVLEDPVRIFEQIEFCQSSPVFTERGWTMVRNYPTSLSKDMVSLLPLKTPELWKKWAMDMGTAGKALNAGVPILYAFYESLARAGSGTFGSHPWISQSGMMRNARGLSGSKVPITDAARVSFWEAFGVSPHDQIIAEESIAKRKFDFSSSSEGNAYDLLTLKQHYLSNDIHKI